jgi:hypothetical protein
MRLDPWEFTLTLICFEAGTDAAARRIGELQRASRGGMFPLPIPVVGVE